MACNATVFTASAAVYTPPANNPSGSGKLFGWSVRSTDGVALVVINIRDGVDATGAIVATIATAHETVPLQEPVLCHKGIYVEVVSGTLPASGGVVYTA